MHCPACDSPNSHIVRTRTLYGQVSRLRKCDACRHQWPTEERYSNEAYNTVKPLMMPPARAPAWHQPKDPAAPRAPDFAVAGTVEELLRQYEIKTLPSIKNPHTMVAYNGAIKVLRQQFGHRRYATSDADAQSPGVLRPPEMNQYLVDNSDRSNAAKKEISLLGRVFRLAKTRWGLTSFNPVDGIEYPSQPPRDAYIDDATFIKMRAAAGPVLRCMMDIASQTGARRGMILDIRVGDIEPDHLVIRVSKKKTRTGFEVVRYALTPDLRAVLNEALALRQSVPGRPAPESDYLFVTRNGLPYTGESFKRLWKTMRDKVGLVSWSFTFHDIRAKAASDSDSDEAAQKLLVHADARITRRVYRRKSATVQPLPAVSTHGRIPSAAS